LSRLLRDVGLLSAVEEKSSVED